ncbi:MAG: hypothetical protein AVDCRST_MAG77-1751 [uncultured Chloroflexi bacterium]|uniref:Uncharacterized protein n=1 Tax=uncultured Chloroflexota bacterium TaxID=166587 RepID=A0A6J4I8G0_9CHLR|nr:MAG: hypothetical protein AVDCRST_MAG77-1751 [uncultured Chloroflexota bacterium]
MSRTAATARESPRRDVVARVFRLVAVTNRHLCLLRQCTVLLVRSEHRRGDASIVALERVEQPVSCFTVV